MSEFAGSAPGMNENILVTAARGRLPAGACSPYASTARDSSKRVYFIKEYFGDLQI